MKIKKLIPYVIIFLISFFGTPILITQFVKIANKNAQLYIQDFTPSTSSLPDGNYIGKYKAYKLFTMSKVEFTVQNGIIIDVSIDKLLHTPGSAYKDDIEKKIRQNKALEIDAVTGATRTSNFAKAAIKNAIESKNIPHANSF
jgi:uncharacterized protein with FMN-binding domain